MTERERTERALGLAERAISAFTKLAAYYEQLADEIAALPGIEIPDEDYKVSASALEYAFREELVELRGALTDG